MRAEQEIKVLVVEPRKHPYTKTIINELSAMQEIVGGYIECLDIDDEVSVVCNEEGKLIQLPLNRALRDNEGEIWEIVAGTFFVAGNDYENSEFISLTDEQITFYTDMFNHPQEFLMVNGKIVAINVDADDKDHIAEPDDDKPTKDEFLAYRDVQMSGLVNMFNIKKVMELACLRKETIMYIMEHYSDLQNEYCK